jgi:hypothetical protein
VAEIFARYVCSHAEQVSLREFISLLHLLDALVAERKGEVLWATTVDDIDLVAINV